ncbi:rhomboid-like protein 2 [Tanacetum coccineum]
MGTSDLESNKNNNNRGPHGGGGGSYYTTSSPYESETSDKQWTSWLVPMIVVANVAMFFIIMLVKDCPKNHNSSLQADISVGIKRLHDDLRVTATKLMLLVYKLPRLRMDKDRRKDKDLLETKITYVINLFKWDQQVVSELVASRNFVKKKLLLHSRSVCYKEMDQDSVHVVAASKVPMLKPGEYELWRMWMEQYIQMIDYSL